MARAHEDKLSDKNCPLLQSLSSIRSLDTCRLLHYEPLAGCCIVDLMAGLHRSCAFDAERRYIPWIHVSCRAGKTAQSAFGGRVRNTTFSHQPAHEFHGSIVEYHSVIRTEGTHADCIVNWHEWLNTGTENTVVLFAEIVRAEISSLIDKVLNDRNIAKVCSYHQWRDTVVVLPVDVTTEFHE